MVTVTVQGTAQEVLKEMEQLCNLQSVTIKSLPMDDIGKALKSTKKETAAPTAPPQAPVASTPAPSNQVPAAPAGAVTLADIQAIVPKLAAKIKRDGVLELFKKYGATKGSEIKPEDYEKFHAEAKGLLA